nr:ABC transporter ATP-binding protein [Lachnospiraceae bacterium]
MIGMIHRILRFSGEYAWKIRFAYVVSFLKSICNTFPLMMAVWVLNGFIHDTVNVTKCLMVGGAIFVVFLVYGLLQTISDQLQSGTGYKIFADQRKKFGAHLKKLPMGYFTEGNIGRISSILSQDMVYIEEQSMTVIADATMDMFSQCLTIVFLFWIHPYLGIVIGAVTLIIILVAQLMIRRSKKGAKGRNIAIEDLTGSVLEYTEGLPIIKSF